MVTLNFVTHGNSAPSLRIGAYAENFIRKDPEIQAYDVDKFTFMGVDYPIATTTVTIDAVAVPGNAYAIAAAISAIFLKANSGTGGSGVIFDASINQLKAVGSDGTQYFFAPSSSLDVATAAYFSRMAAASSTLNTAEKNGYAALIASAKTKPYYAKLKALYFYWGGTNGAKLNTLSTSFTQGWNNITYARFAAHGNGTNGYATTGFIPSIEVPGFSFAFGSLGIDNSNTATVIELGCKNGATEAWLAPEISGALYSQCFSAASSPTATVPDPSGLISISRISQTDVRAFRAGSQIGITNVVSEPLAPPNVEVYIWGQNNNGTLVGPSPYGHKMDYLASGLTATDIADFNADLAVFFAAVG